MSNPHYFVDHKRGEVNELKAILRNPKLLKDQEKRRDVIKKVIAYLTLGIDVSKLFGEMVMAANTRDLVQKKMVYHYLCSYASQKSDLAILAINTLHKDGQDDDPMVRGLALRSLCSLRLENLAEYVLMPIRRGLNDPSSYVRKTAVLGCAKLHKQSPEAVKNSDLVDVLYNMLKDKDVLVITCTINALNEILASEGGMVFNPQIILYLLNRIKEFNEWGQCIVLDLVSRYVPQNDQEMFDVMNLLEDRLKHSNSAVVLGTTKVFLNFTQNNLQVHTEVYKRLKAPLLTLIGGGSAEIAYSVLSHVQLLTGRAPGVFDEDFKHFYVRYNDPSCVKTQKLQILTLLCNERNMGAIMSELAEYVSDVDAEIARSSIKGIGSIAIRIPTAIDDAIEHLLSFVDMNVEYTTTESVIVIKDLLRKYPERYEEVIPSLLKALKTVEEENGKVAVIWMIGEYGDTIDEAPYMLEPLIDSFEEESSHIVRNELLTAAMKLFFKRPPEMQKMLGRLLKLAVEDMSRVDVRDRALLYYRLLSLDVHEAARVVNCPKVVVEDFVDADDVEAKNKIFQEFNSLAVLYDMPSEKFVKYVPLDEDEPLGGEEEDEGGATADAEQEVIVDEQPQSIEDFSAPEPDLMGGGDSLPVPNTPSLILAPSPTVAPQDFQNFWTQLSVLSEVNVNFSQQPDQAQLEQACAAEQIMTMASGVQGDLIKLYLFARNSEGGALFMVEAVASISTGNFRGTIKAQGTAEEGEAFADILKRAISPMC